MLTKQPFPINFAEGLDTKTDPFQLQLGQFLALENSVFTKGKRLTKRNGYVNLASLPSPASYVTTFNGDLTAVGSQIEAYSSSNKDWVSKGMITPLKMQTLPLIRNNINQIQSDSAVSPNGLVCTVYTETDGTTNFHKYAVADAITGQNIVAPKAIANADPTYGTPKVFLLKNWFIIVYTIHPSAYELAFIAVNINNPTLITSQQIVTTNYAPATTVDFDGTVFNDSVYLAWNGVSPAGINMANISGLLLVSANVSLDAAHSATIISLTADIPNSVIWVNYYNSGSSTGYSLVVYPGMQVVFGFPVQIVSTGTYLNITSQAREGVCSVFLEQSHTDNGIQTNFVQALTVNQITGGVSSKVVSLRSVGLASKAFLINGLIYYWGVYSSIYQTTYFLVNGDFSGAINPIVIAKLAYENGRGYLTTGLPSVTVSGNNIWTSYLYKDLIEALNNANSSGTVVQGGIYSQTGINQVSLMFTSDGIETSEIGSNLNITGGYLNAYDGYTVAEQGFHLWPDSVQATGSATSGAMEEQTYFYIVTYEWTDNQGNAFRSAPSIPVEVILSSDTSVDLIIPTLRITAKVANPVKIVIYRWSTQHQTFYQTTSITKPLLNDTTVDSVTYNDKLIDTDIIGNNILYTTGGVIENIGPPACSAITLFDDRLWLVDAEDPNLLWFSKQVIESTPVEMSDLLTIYVAPTIGATGPTGPITALSTMDDKLIILKKTAAYYINGTGPDNTGANNQYSQPTFITSMIGCTNQRSIVFQPQGLMFEFASESGNQIWLLGRDLSTQYIGSPVEELTKNSTVLSSIAVPGTNEVRFNMSNGITLKYDYFYGKWGTHSTNAVASTLYQGLHTYISPYGTVFQETPGVYLDGTNPVLMSFTTGWINVAGLRGYERSYFFYLLGQYLSPFTLQLAIAYDYETAPTSFATIAPTNFSPNYGSPEFNGQETTYGNDNPYGGQGNILNWRVFLKKQRCSSFQISLQEVYDPSFGIVAGEGFTLSGISLICSIKSGFKTISSRHSVGAS